MDMDEGQLGNSWTKEKYLKQIVREQLIPNRFFNYGELAKIPKCIGIIGTRGSCKSLSAAGIAIVDGLISGRRVLSNMPIHWGLRLGDYTVAYKSEDLDKAALLNLDIEGDILAIVDEVNLEFSEARRALTNRNLIFNKLLQQLRKKRLDLIYTVQNEMWVDLRLRWQTDFFILTKDIKLKPGGISLPFAFGEIAEWSVYDMPGYLGRGSFQQTLRPAIVTNFLGKKWWGTFDTNQLQAEDELSYGRQKAPKEAWGWFYEKIAALVSNAGKDTLIPPTYLWEFLEIEEKDISPLAVGRKLSEIGVSIRTEGGERLYSFANVRLKSIEVEEGVENGAIS